MAKREKPEETTGTDTNNEGGAPGVDQTTPEVAPVPKKTRKPRTASAPKAPTFTDSDLQRFAGHIAADLKAARLDESVSDEAMFDLFTLDKKLKAMIGGANVENS